MNYSAPRGWLYPSLAVPIGSNAGRLTVSLSRLSLNWIEQISSDTGETKSNVVAALLEYAKKAANEQYNDSLQRELAQTNGHFSISELDDQNHEHFANLYGLYSSIPEGTIVVEGVESDNT